MVELKNVYYDIVNRMCLNGVYGGMFSFVFFDFFLYFYFEYIGLNLLWVVKFCKIMVVSCDYWMCVMLFGGFELFIEYRYSVECASGEKESYVSGGLLCLFVGLEMKEDLFVGLKCGFDIVFMDVVGVSVVM